MRKDWIMVALSLTCLVGLWAVAAAIKNDALILPTPLHVAQVWAALWQSGELWTHLSATLIRVRLVPPDVYLIRVFNQSS